MSSIRLLASLDKMISTLGGNVQTPQNLKHNRHHPGYNVKSLAYKEHGKHDPFSKKTIQTLAQKDFKAAYTIMLNDIKEKMLFMSKNTGNHSREKESIWYHIENLNLKIIIYQIRQSLNGLKVIILVEMINEKVNECEGINRNNSF